MKRVTGFIKWEKEEDLTQTYDKISQNTNGWSVGGKMVKLLASGAKDQGFGWLHDPITLILILAFHWTTIYFINGGWVCFINWWSLIF